jgi:hypothetical protein
LGCAINYGPVAAPPPPAPGTVVLNGAIIEGGVVAGSVAGGNDLITIMGTSEIGNGAQIVNATIAQQQGLNTARLDLGYSYAPSGKTFAVSISNSTITVPEISIEGQVTIVGDTTLSGEIFSRAAAPWTVDIVVNPGVTLTLLDTTWASPAFNAPIVDNGTIAISGTSQIAGAVTGSGIIRINAGATLDLVSNQTTQNVVFGGSTGTLRIDDPGTGPQATYHLQGGGSALPTGDVIDLVHVAFNPAADSYNAGTGVITVGDGSTASVTIKVAGGVAAGTTFAFQSDGHGGTMVRPTTVFAPTISTDGLTLTSSVAVSGIAKAVAYANGEVYVATNDGQVEAFCAHGSTLLWTQTWSGTGHFLGVAADANYVYAVGSDASLQPLMVRFAADDNPAVTPLQFDTSGFANIYQPGADIYNGGTLDNVFISSQQHIYAAGDVNILVGARNEPIFAIGEYDSSGTPLATSDPLLGYTGGLIQANVYGATEWNGSISMVGYSNSSFGLIGSSYAAVWVEPTGLTPNNSTPRVTPLADIAAGKSSAFLGVATIGTSLYAVGYSGSSPNSNLIAKYDSDGTLAWNDTFGAGELTGAVAVDGRLFVVERPLSGSDVLMEINPSNGDVLSTVQTGSTGTPSLASDGHYLYVTSTNGSLQTYEIGGASHADVNTAVVMHGISVADDGTGSDLIEVTLSAGHGAVTLQDGTGLDHTVTGAHSIELFGSVAQIDAALANGVIYNPSSDYTGVDALTIGVNDLGHNTSGVATTASQSIDLTVGNQIIDHASYTIGTPSSEAVSFVTDHGTLGLAQPSTFSGEITGMTGSSLQVLDLGGFDAVHDQVVASTGAGSFNSATDTTTLTVTDQATHNSVLLSLMGDLSHFNWNITDDTHGGVNVAAAAPHNVVVTATGPHTIVTGSGGVDNFVFNSTLAQNTTVTNFHEGADTIAFSSSLFSNVGQIFNSAADDGHGNTVITESYTTSIVLTGVAVAQLHASDFHIL